MRLPSVKSVVVHSVALLVIVATSPAMNAKAADIVKENNNVALNDPASWVNATVPGATDVALWNNVFVGTVNPNPFDIGSSLTWGQINIGNTAGTGNIRIQDTTGAGTSTLTLNGVGGFGVRLTGNRDLTLGASGANTADSLAIILGSSQAWNIPSGRTITLNGRRGPALGSNVLTISGGGTFAYNPSSLSTVATSSAGAGIVVNGSTFNTTVALGSGGGNYTNWMGANTSLTIRESFREPELGTSSAVAQLPLAATTLTLALPMSAQAF